MCMNPLVWLTRRYPKAFGLEWVVVEEPFPTDDPKTWDLRQIRLLTGGYEWRLKATSFIDGDDRAL
jgi:hypothetical protein